MKVKISEVNKEKTFAFEKVVKHMYIEHIVAYLMINKKIMFLINLLINIVIFSFSVLNQIVRNI